MLACVFSSFHFVFHVTKSQEQEQEREAESIRCKNLRTQ